MWCSMIVFLVVRDGAVWCRAGWCGMVSSSMVRYGVVQYGAVWCLLVLYGLGALIRVRHDGL